MAEKSQSPSPRQEKPAAAPPPAQDIFDVRKIRRLVELMREHDLTQMDLRQGEMRIQLCRGTSGSVDVSHGAPGLVAARPAPATAPVPVAAVPSTVPAPAEAKDEKLVMIKSPMVGTFYAAPDPESSPYVKVGDHVGPETTVCIVEAMKVFNEIPAEVSGKIVAVLVENGEPVEFGQPLFKVDPRG